MLKVMENSAALAAKVAQGNSATALEGLPIVLVDRLEMESLSARIVTFE